MLGLGFQNLNLSEDSHTGFSKPQTPPPPSWTPKILTLCLGCTLEFTFEQNLRKCCCCQCLACSLSQRCGFLVLFNVEPSQITEGQGRREMARKLVIMTSLRAARRGFAEQLCRELLAWTFPTEVVGCDVFSFPRPTNLFITCLGRQTWDQKIYGRRKKKKIRD